MEMPDYFDDGTGRVCKLFIRSKMDGEIYSRTVGVYVNDLIIVGTDVNIELVLRELRTKFQIKDLGSVTDLLHMVVLCVPGQAL
ncbi:hypothetical protein PHMEG_00017779 [Phytophthora megakarya]|uniref:Reverse transcriptase Ty1/copia-type domain-containing protein n=1 Tax=Phytophthora megakarya TaxID=4795 RepID=A0A225VVG1_9STRA|nr:hypothetical protein PHMEG_00017779 [Phytophthora megakarya]